MVVRKRKGGASSDWQKLNSPLYQTQNSQQRADFLLATSKGIASNFDSKGLNTNVPAIYSENSSIVRGPVTAVIGENKIPLLSTISGQLVQPFKGGKNRKGGASSDWKTLNNVVPQWNSQRQLHDSAIEIQKGLEGIGLSGERPAYVKGESAGGGNYMKMTKKELLKKAKKLNKKTTSNMTKAEIIKKIKS